MTRVGKNEVVVPMVVWNSYKLRRHARCWKDFAEQWNSIIGVTGKYGKMPIGILEAEFTSNNTNMKIEFVCGQRHIKEMDAV